MNPPNSLGNSAIRMSNDRARSFGITSVISTRTIRSTSGGYSMKLRPQMFASTSLESADYSHQWRGGTSETSDDGFVAILVETRR